MVRFLNTDAAMPAAQACTKHSACRTFADVRTADVRKLTLHVYVRCGHYLRSGKGSEDLQTVGVILLQICFPLRQLPFDALRLRRGGRWSYGRFLNVRPSHPVPATQSKLGSVSWHVPIG